MTAEKSESRKQIERKHRGQTRQELVRIAAKLKIVGRHRMKKEELVRAIAAIKGKKRSRKPETPKSSRPANRRRRTVKQSILPLLEEKVDLPTSYGETKVVLLPVDPYLIHAYWEVAPSDLEKAKLRLGADYERSREVLRFYPGTDIIFNGSNAQRYFDVGIDLQAKNWYVRLQSPERSYCVDLGWKTEDERFLPVTRSNVVETPRAWPSKRMEKTYMLVDGNYDRVRQVSTAAGPQITRPESPFPLEGERPFDLTEMGEKLFISGISSKPGKGIS